MEPEKGGGGGWRGRGGLRGGEKGKGGLGDGRPGDPVSSDGWGWPEAAGGTTSH